MPVTNRSGLPLEGIVARSSSLALHKSLMGIAQLSAIESATEKSQYGNFRMPKALLTYCAIYHLFTASILLSNRMPDKKRLQKILEQLPDKTYVGTTTESKLNNDNEQSDVWDSQRECESDVATLIQHFQIKEYCKELRGLKAQGEAMLPFESILYDLFIGDEPKDREKCIVGMYEKLCYIRDRVIYRPTFVIDDTGHQYQTSKDVRAEIDSLPKAHDIYNCVSLFILELAKGASEIDLHWRTMFDFTIPHNTRYMDELISIGHTKKQLQNFLDKCKEACHTFDNGEIVVLPHISHLLELEDMDTTIAWHKEFWAPLLKQVKQKLFG